ncbi:MAG TPA: acyl-CoA dehydrogenase family protein [Actinomycetota bacterium]|nr:acyl-CoA dehydrogenase family protein [Actinomycetota bacterium]
MDFELPPEDDPRRLEVRKWLADHPNPSVRDMAEGGYVVPHWPKPWGLEADPLTQLVIADELTRAGAPRPINPIGIGHCGPILVMHGTDEQKQRYLPPMLASEEIWCQLFSEPGAGSDLASVDTRAVRTDDGYVVNGQKIWTSLGHFAQLGILLARTDPEAPKHEGLSYFIVDMKSPGIEVRPIVDATGWHNEAGGFNEVFFTDVHIPADALIGEENKGWELARQTLANERVTLSHEGAQWGWGPTAQDLVALVRDQGGTTDATLRQRLAHLYSEGEILRVRNLLSVAARIAGKDPGPEAAVRKALADPHGRDVFRVAKDLAGTAGMLSDAGPLGTPGGWWAQGFLFSPALTIGGGTSEVLRNVIAERILGLPREPDPDSGKPWNEVRTAHGRGATD